MADLGVERAGTANPQPGSSASVTSAEGWEAGTRSFEFYRVWTGVCLLPSLILFFFFPFL